MIVYTLVYKRVCELNKSHIISTDEDPGLRPIKSLAVINGNTITWCFHKQKVLYLVSLVINTIVRLIRGYPCWNYRNRHKKEGRDYFAGLRVTKRNKATVLLTLTLLQLNTNSNLNPNPYLSPNLTILQICF